MMLEYKMAEMEIDWFEEDVDYIITASVGGGGGSVTDPESCVAKLAGSYDCPEDGGICGQFE